MEYITGSNTNLTSDAYHFTLNYPESYKSNETKIIKFERDYNRFLEYRFIGLFPLALNSTRVSYQGSTVLKASASFSFDRYICGESSSLARDLKRAFNEIFNLGNNVRDGDGITANQNLLEANTYGPIAGNILNPNGGANGQYGSKDLSSNSSSRFSYPPGGTRIV